MEKIVTSFLSFLLIGSAFSCVSYSCLEDEASLYDGVVRTPPTKDYHPALVVSIGDDDTIDFFLRQSSTIRSGENGGFFPDFIP